MLASVAKRLEKKPVVEVELVERRLEIVPFVPFKFVAVIPVAEAVVSVVCPVMLRVPPDVSEDVAVTTPAVRVLTVALVVVELPTTRLVILVSVVKRDEINEFVEVLLLDTRLVIVPFVLLKFVEVPFVALKLFAVSNEIVVVESVVTPANVLSPANV